MKNLLSSMKLIVAIIAFGFLKLSAQPLLVENFEYANGTALSSTGWTAHSGAGTNPILVGEGLSFAGYSGSNIGGAAYVSNNGEDVHKTFQPVTSDEIYVAFMLKTEAANAAGYFLHLGQQVIGTTYITRVYVNATGDGIGLSGGTAPTVYAPITPNVTHLVVLKHNLSTKLSSLYVFTTMPTTEPLQAASSFTETLSYSGVGSIALRQYNAAQRAVVDGIRVATSWNTAIGTGGNPNVPALTANPSLLNGFAYNVGGGPSAVQTYTVSGSNLEGIGQINLLAPADYEISTNGTNFSGWLNLPFAAGVITGQPVTIHVRLKAGLPIGTYNNQQINHSGGGAAAASVTLNGEVGSGLTPQIAAEIVPQYIQGLNGTNATRVPYAFWLNLSNLTPNTTYRYIHQVVTSADGPTVNGAGNPIFVTETGSFIRTSSPNLATDGAYGSFTTNAQGSYSGWFIVEPSGNARFTPGNEVFFRIRLNDGNNGTVAVTFLTTTNFAKVINFGTEAAATQGTAVRALSPSASKNFVLLYDNPAGDGRPVYGTSIESTGVDFLAVTIWAQYYRDHVAGVDGAWGGILPNMLANGIRRIEERSKIGGALVQSFTSSTGSWSGVNTINPNGGLDNVLVINLNTTNTPVLTVNPTTLSGFSYIQGQGPSTTQSYTITGQFLEGSGNISVSAPSAYEISTNGTTFSQSINLPFAGGAITGQPVTIQVRLKAGLAIGAYNGQIISHNGGGAAEKTVTLNGDVTSGVNPAIEASIAPKFIQGASPTNNTRLPFAWWVRIINLTPGATYRYIHQAVISTDLPNAGGAGNPIFVSQSGIFSRSTSPSLSTEGGYGTFTANNQGAYEGWFMVEPTGNSRFTIGNDIYFRIRLNDGNNGTIAVQFLTVSDATRIIDFGDNLLANEGSSIRAISTDPAKSIVSLFDNVNGGGRPVTITHVEASGIDFAGITSYVPYYRDHVSGNNGSWGTIIPNLNAQGIRLIKVQNPFTGYLKEYASATGLWGSVDTRNPDNGLLTTLVLNLTTIGLQEYSGNSLKIFADNHRILLLDETLNEGLLSVFNTMGQRVISLDIKNNGRVISHNLPAGTYIVQLLNSIARGHAVIIVR